MSGQTCRQDEQSGTKTITDFNMKKPNTKLRTSKKDYYECERCQISSQTKGRMIPCPRGGCEAELKGETVTTRQLFLHEQEQGLPTKESN